MSLSSSSVMVTSPNHSRLLAPAQPKAGGWLLEVAGPGLEGGQVAVLRRCVRLSRDIRYNCNTSVRESENAVKAKFAEFPFQRLSGNSLESS